MSFSIQFADESSHSYDARIKVIGVGGSGGNAVNTMMSLGLEGVEFIAVNTDAQALAQSLAPTKMQIGTAITRGLGAGADPERGRKAALEDVQRIKELLAGTDMVFITAGMGGGTGTGAAPVIAQLAREEDILVVGVATKPFKFEGRQRSRRADQGISTFSKSVDTLVTIPNEKLLTLGEDDLSFIEAFRKADEVLYQAVKGISDLITQGGMVNVDFADVKTVMSNMGRALMGTGCAKGEGRARFAAELAIKSPLLDEISVEGATGVLINIVGGSDMRMREVNEAVSLIEEQAHEEADIIFGAAIDESLGDAIKVTVVATGFDRLAHGAHEIDVTVDHESSREALSELARKSSLSRPAARASVVPPALPMQTSAGPRSRPMPRVERVERYEEPVSPSRRYAQEPALPARAAAPAERHFLAAREDHDWDIPAYIRRGS